MAAAWNGSCVTLRVSGVITKRIVRILREVIVSGIVFRIFLQFTVCTDKLGAKLCVAAPLAIVQPVERTPPLQTLRFPGFEKRAKVILPSWVRYSESRSC